MYRFSAAMLFSSLLLLSGCGGTPPVVEEPPPPAQEPVPEITLNLPSENCVCEEAEAQDYTFLEKGFRTLHDGEYLEALQYFKRYQRIETSPRADYEARIAIAYLSILPDSPIFDSRSVEKGYPSLRRSRDPDWRVHDQILLMEETLEVFLDMQRQISRLQQSNRDLRGELQQKVEAIRRLKEVLLEPEPEPVDLL
jgi:hypothetical protein